MPKLPKPVKTPELKQINWSIIITAIFLIVLSYARNVGLSKSTSLDKLAVQTPGFAGADLANLINEAALKELAQSLLDKEILEG